MPELVRAAADAPALVACARGLVAEFGIDLSRELAPDARGLRRQMAHLLAHEPPAAAAPAAIARRALPPVNMMRVTGRPESAQQRRAPWGYAGRPRRGRAARADRGARARRARGVVRRARRRRRRGAALELGALRDVTLSYRWRCVLRLDPHLDPADDGPNVVVVSLLSPAVLTLSRAARARARRLRRAGRRGRALVGARRGRRRARAAARGGPASERRAPRAHARAVRLGVSRAQLAALGDRGAGGGPNDGVIALYDWWGSVRHPVARGPERLSMAARVRGRRRGAVAHAGALAARR